MEQPVTQDHMWATTDEKRLIFVQNELQRNSWIKSLKY